MRAIQCGPLVVAAACWFVTGQAAAQQEGVEGTMSQEQLREMRRELAF